MRRTAPFLVVVCLAGGCGSKSHSVVRITALDLASHGTVVAVAAPQANGHEAPLASLRALLPQPLPVATRCNGRPAVTIAYSDGRVVRYGSCALPDSIRVLQDAVTSEARQWSARTALRTTITGARPRERATLRRLLAKLAPSRIRSVRIGRVLHPARWNIPNGTVQLDVQAGTSLRGEWEAALLGDLYAAAADRLGLRPVGLVASGSGTSQPGVVGGARVSFASVRRAARAGGARVVELRHQAGAVALTLRTDRPAVFLKHHGRQVVRAVQPKASYDLVSVYVGVEDGTGSLVYAWGWLPAEGMMWARPDLDACGPIFHSTPVGYHGPPCPA